MPHYIQHGTTITQAAEADMIVHDLLPTGTYNIGHDPMSGFFFTRIDPMVAPERVYGEHGEMADRIFTTTTRRMAEGKGSTGVLLAGEKGSGKTMISKLVSGAATAKGWPTIVINRPFHGDAFNSFIQGLSQPALIIFDEFEKVYDKDAQPHLLTLLDGVYTGDKLFIFTANDKFKLDVNMRNRPGRIFYAIDFEGLSDAFVREYGDENLDDKSNVNQLVQVAAMFWRFNFDTLQAIVEECNRYRETPVKALRYLNASVQNEQDGSFDVAIWKDGKELEVQRPTYRGSPVDIYDDSWWVYPAGCANDQDQHQYVTFFESDFTGYDKGIFRFRNDKGYEMVLTRHIERRIGFESLGSVPLSLIA